MKVLSKAIVAKFKETTGGVHNSLYTLVSGQIYKERAKQKATTPYLVYHITTVPDWNFCSEFERISVQFDIFSLDNSSEEIEDIFEALKTLFDWCSLSIVGYEHVYMKREVSRLIREPTDDEWHYVIDYEILMEKL